MKRILFIYNPYSSNYVHVKDEVLSRASKIKGYMIGKFAIEKAPFEDNVESLKEVLRDGDIAVAAGGDATAAVAANAILESGKDVTLGVLPYGNFNDLAHTLRTNKFEDLDFSKNEVLYPLDIIVDGIHWRYATCYITAGMTAEAVEIFDNPKIRKSLQKGHRSSWRSYFNLAGWYFKNRHKKVFLPEFTLNGKPTIKKASDYAAVNGRTMSRIMNGGNDFLKPKVFRSEVAKLTGFFRLSKLMATSILFRTPGKDTNGDALEFKKPATIEVQAEGEYKIFEHIKTLRVEKPDKGLKVICRKKKNE